MPRTLRGIIVCSLAAHGLLGCGDPNAGALFADIQYGTDCDETRGCTPAPNRDICGINNGDPCPEVGGTAQLSCIVSEVEGSTRTLSFSASQGGGFSIRLASFGETWASKTVAISFATAL